MNHPNKKRVYPFNRQLKRKLRRIAFILIAAAIAAGVNYYNKHKQPSIESAPTVVIEKSTNSGATTHKKPNKFSDAEQLQAVKQIRAARDRTDSQFWTGINGKVIKLLKDDLKGSRHQKFLIKIAPDITLLISHNIDLASRVPVNKGDSISLRGRYEWNNRGGVIHWTHHDPKGRKQGGWIQLNDKIYR